MARQANKQPASRARWVCKRHVVPASRLRREAVYSQYGELLDETFRRLCSRKGAKIIEGRLISDHVRMLGGRFAQGQHVGRRAQWGRDGDNRHATEPSSSLRASGWITPSCACYHFPRTFCRRHHAFPHLHEKGQGNDPGTETSRRSRHTRKPPGNRRSLPLPPCTPCSMLVWRYGTR